jgi:ABC-type uncharacterized transport system substrate-binding protein
MMILFVLPAVADELLIVQSEHGEVYDQTVRLIQNRCAGNSDLFTMGDYTEFDLDRIVREEQPRLILAIGDQAFREARRIRRPAVAYALTLNVDENSLGDNVKGISMHVAPEHYLKLFKKLQLRRIGILYDPRKSGAYLARTRKVFAGAGVELVALTVRSPRDVPAALERLQRSSIDSLWIIPDSSAVAQESVDAYFRFAQKLNLPVISFAKGYLAKGAVAALEGSRNAIAEQSCTIVRKIRNGVPAAELATVDINAATLHTNETVAARLHLKLTGLERLFPPDKE